jgi:hypothetical protein
MQPQMGQNKIVLPRAGGTTGVYRKWNPHTKNERTTRRADSNATVSKLKNRILFFATVKYWSFL